MKLRHAIWLWSPGLLLAGCLMSRLDTSGSGGSSGESSDAGSTSVGGNKNLGGMVNAAGTTANTDGGTGNPEGGAPDPSNGGTDAGGTLTAGTDSGGTNANGGTDSGGTDAGGTMSNAGTGGGGAGGSGPVASIRDVKPSAMCGKLNNPQTYGTWVKYTINTTGTKAADATGDAGPWSFDREYAVALPSDYDYTNPYPLVIGMPGCGAGSTDVYGLNLAVNGTVILVGLKPPPNAINHAIALNQSCFDDYEGDDSVDVAAYKKIIDELGQKLCYDKNRVFVMGNSSGSTMAGQLACKFAGDKNGYAIRGSLRNTGSWTTSPASAAPTCGTAPIAGLWVHETGDMTNPFTGMKSAVTHAMQVNGCTIGTDYDTAQFDAYKISPTDTTSCKKIKGCPADYPLITCALPGNAHGLHETVMNPAGATLLESLAAP